MSKISSGILALVCVVAVGAGFACSDDDSNVKERQASLECLNGVEATLDERIKPLLTSDRPKTCNQCHLSGVDLGLFVRDTMCETRACLYDNGWIDPENIDQSLVLAWIRRAHPESELITQEVISEEYDAFHDFLEEIAGCGGESCEGVHCDDSAGEVLCDPELEPKKAHLTATDTTCEPLAIESAFRDNVFVWRGRCSPCHFSNHKDAHLTAPRWISVEGGCDNAVATTLRNVIDGGYINTKDPSQSLILLKPLAKDLGGVKHGGGEKFHDTTDLAYESFLSFAEFYAACVNSGQGI